MAARLGQVLYVLGWLLGGALIAGGLYAYNMEGGSKDGPAMLGFFGIPGVIIVLFGYACRYVLAGPTNR